MTSDIGRVLVAGASQGIGEGVALAFAAAGAEVVLGGRREDALDAAAERIGTATGRRPSIVAGDFAARDISPLLAKLPELDVLVVSYGDTDAPAGFDTSEDA